MVMIGFTENLSKSFWLSSNFACLTAKLRVNPGELTRCAARQRRGGASQDSPARRCSGKLSLETHLGIMLHVWLPIVQIVSEL